MSIFLSIQSVILVKILQTSCLTELRLFALYPYHHKLSYHESEVLRFKIVASPKGVRGSLYAK